MTTTHRVGRSMRDAACRPPTLQRFMRRQALPVIRVAADLDSCAGGIARLLRPPHPPTQKAPPRPGATPAGQGGCHSFLQCRDTGALPKTRGSAPPKPRNPHGSMSGGRFGPVEFPRVGVVFPRVGVFSPHGPFSRRGPSSSLHLLFLEEREKRESDAGGKRASTGWDFGYRMYPRVAPPIHGFSVDGFGGGFVGWRGFAGGLGGNPRSTGRNACVPPCGVAWGGVHGADGLV